MRIPRFGLGPGFQLGTGRLSAVRGAVDSCLGIERLEVIEESDKGRNRRRLVVNPRGVGSSIVPDVELLATYAVSHGRSSFL